MTSVIIEREGAVAFVIMSGPALSLTMKEGLLKSLLTVAADEQVRAVVLPGSGRAFCVGQELAEHAALAKGPLARPVDGAAGPQPGDLLHRARPGFSG